MRKFNLAFTVALSVLTIAACQQAPSVAADGAATPANSEATKTLPFTVTAIATFDSPWAITFLPGTGSALITEKSGKLKWLDDKGAVRDVAGAPTVSDDGQGGLADVIPAPDYATSSVIYLSWSEAQGDVSSATVGTAKLVLDAAKPRLEGLKVIWRQTKGYGADVHYSQRLVISPDKKYLFVASGERGQKTPAQDIKSNVGKIVRLNLDGTPAAGNPFAGQGGDADQVWTAGHRNILGMAFDDKGQLWAHEHGPKGGDEINLVEKGVNYGWATVSNGDDYDDTPIPDHPTRPEFRAPNVFWNPSIAPSGMIIYSGAGFPQWQGDMFMGALRGQALYRVELNGGKVQVRDHWDMGTRVRDVEQGPDGNIWLLEDGGGDPGGRLLKLSPKG
jgi:aldose sugar dehydrogenase